MTGSLIHYVFPATYISLAGYVPTPAFWGLLIFYHEEIGLIPSVIWGLVWIALLLIFFTQQINPAFYFPVQLVMAIFLGMVTRYKTIVGR